MRNKVLTGFLCIVLALVLSLGCSPMDALCSEHTVDEVSDLIGGIVDYKLSQCGAGSIDDWLRGDIAAGAGRTSDWYALTLSQYGYTDLSAYESSLTDYLGSNNVLSATSREKYALGLAAAGSQSSYISDILDSSIGEQGIMSWIYGLHVLNNGYTCSRFTSDSVVDTILSMQYGDGGWALFGDYGDIDVTAMTVQALAPHYNSRGDVSKAVDRALDFLSYRQQDNGGYSSFGTPNPESASQVLVALSDLGIDCRYDDRFIKECHDLIDGIIEYRLSDGSFCHSMGSGSNETATVQAFYSLVAFKRMTEGKSPLLVLDNRRLPQSQQEHNDSSQQQVQQSTSAAATASSGAKSTTAKTSTVTTTASVTVSAKTGTSAVTVTISGTVAASTAKITTAAALNTETDHKKNVKPMIIIVIIGAAAVISIIIFILGKRNRKNYLFIVLAAGAAIAVVLLLEIQSADDYYSGEKKQKDNIAGTVTMEIRCDTIAGKSDSEHIPADGVILPPTAFDFESGETVFDILTEAAQAYGIQVENRGSAGSSHGMVYIAGINYIYEYDFGDLSGWVYHVNGITPSRGCGEYELSDGDRIEWLYTCEIGHDLNEVYEK